MTYDETVAALKTLLWVSLNQSDENFQRIIPRMFEYADNRIYRELDFLATTVTAVPAPFTIGNREVGVPSNIIVLRYISIFTPAGAITNASTRHTLERVSPEYLDICWPQSTATTGVPAKYALVGRFVGGPPATYSFSARLQPTPDLSYTGEFYGSVRPLPLSQANQETYLSTVYPDLFIAACMVFGTGYQRDFGAQSDDPARAMSWEAQFKELRNGVMLDSARQKGEGAAWTPQAPAPLASQPRGGAV